MKLFKAGSGAPASQLASGTTDNNGSFNLGGLPCDQSIASSTLLYLAVSGGDTGAGPNPATRLVATLGPCNGADTGKAWMVSEVTTAATAWALSQFVVAGEDVNLQSSSTNAVGLAHAFATAATLADPRTGRVSTSLPTSGQCSAAGPPTNCVAEEKLDSLANALAACVRSTGSASAQCARLFACASAGATVAGDSCDGGSGTPTDTFAAALSVARNPGSISTNGLFLASSAVSTYQPQLAAAPHDWTLARTFAVGSAPEGVAIDSQGNVWIVDENWSAVSRLTATGTALPDISGGGLSTPLSVAVDEADNAWISNSANNSVSKFDSGGNPLSGGTGYTGGGLSTPWGITVAPSGNIWVVNHNANSITALDPSGTPLSGTTGYTGGGLNTSEGIAADQSGKLWIANLDGDSVSAFDSGGKPISGPTGYRGGGFSGPNFDAVDAQGNIWVCNSGDAVTELSPAGAVLSPASGYTGGGLFAPFGIAVDGAGNAWLGNQAETVSEFSSAGVPLSGDRGFGFFVQELDSSLRGIAVDASGNVWVSADIENEVVEFIGAANPVRTPIVAAIKHGFAP